MPNLREGWDTSSEGGHPNLDMVDGTINPVAIPGMKSRIRVKVGPNGASITTDRTHVGSNFPNGKAPEAGRQSGVTQRSR